MAKKPGNAMREFCNGRNERNINVSAAASRHDAGTPCSEQQTHTVACWLALFSVFSVCEMQPQ